MSQTIEHIAQALGARAEGDLSIEVTGASEPATAEPDQIALAMSEKYAEGLREGKARAALLWEGADWRALGLEAAVFVTRPRLAMAGLSKAFDPGPNVEPGIHPTCVIDPTAIIGKDAAIGPFTVIGKEVKIGPNARIVGQVTIAEGAQIGSDALIYPGARIGARVLIGDRLVCQPGAVIGSDGFSFVTPDPSGVEEIRHTLEQREEITEQKWFRIHSLGTVEIGDDVEIGANACIDRGTVRATAIGSGSKLDNMVHIGHNVQVGEDCLLCGQVGIAGSTRIGHRVVLAGQCGVSDNITVGDDVIAAGGTNIYTNVPKGRTIWGSPAVKMETQLEINKSVRRLPRLFAQMAELRETVTKLTQKGGTE
ncbi:UDP-3-O-(3-hydroxymyristoyl)glucosamine N-acyltransferase [Thioclava sp. DLFJ4-1]|uniref:UDP-3-O-(3-hydroxymyristoyl)glucosamine N-acyltransferase n=1 Tax=Thioclava sp. DLFJ4-1 TaxID=1915313 RepID=UPI000997986B|nr:UDP-3-O-(3-hydroxymyristoyl)glucosamine N-acyltransferase [Thioclava sp. DLFJ4-1]OOY17568.1 UDP-3-O-(3-hydroxymyristoyl)glucosamine N-acyltransferase [Thioclava sp. DLFJ4-1]